MLENYGMRFPFEGEVAGENLSRKERKWPAFPFCLLSSATWKRLEEDRNKCHTREILILYSKNCIYARLCKQLFSLSSLSSHMLSHLFTYLLIANIIVSLDLHIESSGDWKSRRKYQIHALRMQSRSIQKLTMESVTFRTSLLSHEQLPSLK